VTEPVEPSAPAKTAVRQAMARLLPDLVALSHQLHADPETSFEEHRSAERVAEVLRRGGFGVTTGVGDLPTAFAATTGDGELHLVLCAEYDALPDVGHACGHNIIAATAAGAGLALAGVADELGLTVTVLGTPAEEGGGGKVLLLERGAFAGAHAALMVHPWPDERLRATCLAVSHFDVTFTGRGAHASAAPWEGVNAGDAMTVAQVAIGLLRQQLPPGDQVHGVVRDGGRAANIIPARVTARYMCRSRTLAGLAVLSERVRQCFAAGCLATGSTVAYEELSPLYSHMEPDEQLLAAYRANAEALGRRFELDDANVAPPTLSTDMANVSLAVPTIHPLIAIDSRGAVNHQPEFAAACATPSADAAVRDGATALALTVVDAATDPGLRAHLLARPA
jgi:amidohydrolase